MHDKTIHTIWCDSLSGGINMLLVAPTQLMRKCSELHIYTIRQRITTYVYLIFQLKCYCDSAKNNLRGFRSSN